MTEHIYRHNLQEYLTFYFEKWPQIEKSINESLNDRIKSEFVLADQSLNIESKE